MVIDLTAQLAPIGIALAVTLVVSAVGIISAIDRREFATLGHWVQVTKDTLSASLRGVSNISRALTLHRG